MSEQWQRQEAEKPLFPDLIWSQPQNRHGAGKLLVIGGQAQEFAHVASAYTAAEQAGAGTIRVIMPESTRKFTRMLPNIEYAPSNASGSFTKNALGEFFAASEWADTVLLAGDLGKNSETTTVLDGYLLRCIAPVAITENALASIALPRDQLLTRPIILIVGQKNLQKLGSLLNLTTPITSDIGAAKLAEILHEITKDKKGSIVAEYSDQCWISAAGQVSSTPAKKPVDQIALAANAAVWAMQNPTKIFEALTTSLVT